MFVDRGRLLSLKRRIAAAQSFALTELTEEVAALAPPVPEELVAAIAERIEQGAYVVTGAVASLVAATRSRRLYVAAREHVFGDCWALIKLLRADIPDPAIEKQLRNGLYRVYQDSAEPRRSEILRALVEHGSTDCLDDLEAMQYELAPKLQTLKLARDMASEPEHLDPRLSLEEQFHVVTRRADLVFGESLQSAIQRIRERGKLPANDWAATAAADHPFAFAKAYIQRAEQHVAGQDYGAALNYCRKALEAALKSFVRRRGINIRKDGPIDKLELPPLIAAINSQVALPKDIRMAIDAVKTDSTYGSHDQGVASKVNLTAAVAQATIDKYRQVEAHLTQIMT
jgi:hypothetical protein